MAGQYIKQAPILGRLGESLGKGLSEVVPKEAERYRLSQGLKQFEKESANLTPLQQYTRLLSIPGMPTAGIQAIPEILKNQSYRQGLANRPGAPRQGGISSQGEAPTVEQSNYNNQVREQAGNTDQTGQSQRKEIVTPSESGQPQVSPGNPVRQEALPGRPFTQDQWLDEMDQASQQFPNASIQDLESYVANKEQRHLSQPKYQQEYDAYKQEKKKEIATEFNSQLEKHLHKEGNETFKDTAGDLQSDMLRTIERDIAENPRRSVSDVVKQGVGKLFSFAKAKNDVDTLATKPIQDFLTPGKREAAQNDLKSYSKIYNDLDRNEEFFDKLRTKTPKKDIPGLTNGFGYFSPQTPNVIGFGLTHRKAAGISFPIKNVPDLEKHIRSNSRNDVDIKDAQKESVSQAIKIEPFLKDPKASILAIVDEYQNTMRNFDSNAFFNQIREDWESGRLKLSDFQEREMGMSQQDIFPNWNDYFYLPLRRK